MKEVGHIQEKQFYYSTIGELLGGCNDEEKCALIIDNTSLEELLTVGTEVIEDNVGQLVVVNKDLNTTIPKIGSKNLLLVAGKDFEEALCLSALGLFEKVICIPEEDEKIVRELVNVIKI